MIFEIIQFHSTKVNRTNLNTCSFYISIIFFLFFFASKLIFSIIFHRGALRLSPFVSPGISCLFSFELKNRSKKKTQAYNF